MIGFGMGIGWTRNATSRMSIGERTARSSRRSNTSSETERARGVFGSDSDSAGQMNGRRNVRRQCVSSVGLAGAIATLLLGGPGQTQELAEGTGAVSTEQSAWSPSLLADGQPDMQGLYVPEWGSVPPESSTREERERYAALLVERYDIHNQNSPRGAGVLGGGGSPEFGEGDLQGDRPLETVMVVDPPDGKVPYLPWADAKRKYMQEHLYDREEFISTRTRCFPAGLPRDMTMGSGYNGWQVVQAPGVVVILTEWNHTYRTIRLDGSPHVGADIQLWMGDSRGRWEGNTLVVDATNFNDKTWVVGNRVGDGPSNNSFHSTALHLQERFTIVDADHIDYEATVTDPNVFTRPWTLRKKLWKRAEEGYELFEYACHEGNVGWEGIKARLSGDSSRP